MLLVIIYVSQRTRRLQAGDSLSLILFNVVMDEIIKEIKRMRGYRMGRSAVSYTHLDVYKRQMQVNV